MKGAAAGNVVAVVVGADICGLGLVRSLGQAGIPVVVTDTDRRRPAMHSRYARPFVVPSLSGTGLVESLLAVAKPLDCRPVLFLTTDAQVRTVSEHRDVLQAYHIRLPDHRTVCELLHKTGFQTSAERHGFPVPVSLTVRKPDDLVELRRLRFPVVIKPGDKTAFFQGKAPRALRVDDHDRAEAACRGILREVTDLIVQEWIEGPDDQIYFCLQYYDRTGVPVGSFTGRKLRSWPPGTGSTASCIPAPEVAESLEPLACAFFQAVGMTGMCSMEFKRDVRSGAFFMIEPTIGRADWQEEVATLNGINMPLVAYRQALGLPAPSPGRVPRRTIWRDPSCYWRSVAAARSFHARPPAGALVKGSCWRKDDPVPLAYCWLEWGRKGLSLRRAKV
jgi:predicted ATP-grasp superfamily ATP-dependent carboligase